MKKQYLIILFFGILALKDTSAQLSLNIGLHRTDMTGFDDVDTTRNYNIGSYQYSQAKGSIDFSLRWHQKINSYLELETGFGYTNANYTIIAHFIENHSTSYNYLQSISTPIAINGLLPLSERSNLVLIVGFTPHYVIAADDGGGFNIMLSPFAVYPTSYKKWLYTLDFGIGYRLKIHDKHQIRIDINYKNGLNHFVNDTDNFPSNYLSQLKTRNIGMTIGYIFQLNHNQ